MSQEFVRPLQAIDATTMTMARALYRVAHHGGQPQAKRRFILGVRKELLLKGASPDRVMQPG